MPDHSRNRMRRDRAFPSSPQLVTSETARVMNDAYKPKQQLLEELEDLRRRLAGFQTSEARDAWTARRIGAARERGALPRAVRKRERHRLHARSDRPLHVDQQVGRSDHRLHPRRSAADDDGADRRARVPGRGASRCCDPTAGARSRHELEIIAKDGRRVAVEINTRFVTQGDRPVGVQGIARDVTDRKQAEEALRIQHEQQQTVLDSVPAMMVYTDIGGPGAAHQQDGRALFNRPVSELEGRSLESVSAPLGRGSAGRLSGGHRRCSVRWPACCAR